MTACTQRMAACTQRISSDLDLRGTHSRRKITCEELMHSA